MTLVRVWIVVLGLIAVRTVSAAATQISSYQMQIGADDPGLFVRGTCRFESVQTTQVELAIPQGARQTGVATIPEVPTQVEGSTVVVMGVTGSVEVDFVYSVPWQTDRTELFVRQRYPITNVLASVAPMDLRVRALGLRAAGGPGGAGVYAAESVPAGVGFSLTFDSPRVPPLTTLSRAVVRGSVILVAFFVGMGCSPRRDNRAG